MVYDEYISRKSNYLCYLVFMKVGNFYQTFDDDAVIMNYLFGYKIKDNRVGFPISSFNKIINKLDKSNINYFIDDIEKRFDNNNYSSLLEKSNDILELKIDFDNIYSYLYSNIERKYIRRVVNKIKDVIDEG